MDHKRKYRTPPPLAREKGVGRQQPYRCNVLEHGSFSGFLCGEYIYYRFIVRFPTGLDFLFITFTFLLHLLLSWTSSLSISSCICSESCVLYSAATGVQRVNVLSGMRMRMRLFVFVHVGISYRHDSILLLCVHVMVIPSALS